MFFIKKSIFYTMIKKLEKYFKTNIKIKITYTKFSFYDKILEKFDMETVIKTGWKVIKSTKKSSKIIVQ